MGHLILELYFQRGGDKDKIIIAGRNSSRLMQLSLKYDVTYRVFDLKSPNIIDQNIRDVFAVLLIAGPFFRTSKPMLEACIRTKTHYMDISGEPDVLQFALSQDVLCKQANIVCISGFGFCSTVSECFARMLKEQMPNGVSLSLALDIHESMSAGTAKSLVDYLATEKPSMVVSQGNLAYAEPFSRTRSIDFTSGTKQGVLIPAGDIINIYHRTHIPNIDIYVAIKPSKVNRARNSFSFLKAVKYLPFLKPVLHHVIDMLMKGATEEQRRILRTEAWGELRDEEGNKIVGTISTPHSYTCTGLICLKGMKMLREQSKSISVGSCTPTTAFGFEFLKEIEGVEIRPFERQPVTVSAKETQPIGPLTPKGIEPIISPPAPLVSHEE